MSVIYSVFVYVPVAVAVRSNFVFIVLFSVLKTTLTTIVCSNCIPLIPLNIGTDMNEYQQNKQKQGKKRRGNQKTATMTSKTKKNEEKWNGIVHNENHLNFYTFSHFYFCHSHTFNNYLFTFCVFSLVDLSSLIFFLLVFFDVGKKKTRMFYKLQSFIPHTHTHSRLCLGKEICWSSAGVVSCVCALLCARNYHLLFSHVSSFHLFRPAINR